MLQRRKESINISLYSKIELHLEKHATTHKTVLNQMLAVTETELPSINIASIRFQGQYHEIGIYLVIII